MTFHEMPRWRSRPSQWRPSSKWLLVRERAGVTLPDVVVLIPENLPKFPVTKPREFHHKTKGWCRNLAITPADEALTCQISLYFPCKSGKRVETSSPRTAHTTKILHRISASDSRQCRLLPVSNPNRGHRRNRRPKGPHLVMAPDSPIYALDLAPSMGQGRLCVCRK